MTTFPFVETYSEKLGIVKRPFAVVRLINSGVRLVVQMLVDLGADVSIVSYERGLELGFKIKETEQISTLGGLGGGIPVVYRNLQMSS